jgi:hypothetical protein
MSSTETDPESNSSSELDSSLPAKRYSVIAGVGLFASPEDAEHFSQLWLVAMDTAARVINEEYFGGRLQLLPATEEDFEPQVQ